MEFNPWEERSYKKLLRLYKNFYKTLKEESRKCYEIDSHKIFNLDTKKLERNQKEQILKYWNKYIKNINLDYHRYYIDKTGSFDVRFIPDDIFAGFIDPYLNNREMEPGVADKNYFDMYFKGFNMPETYLRLINGVYLNKDYKIITKIKAKELLYGKDFIVKPSTASYGGKNIKFYIKPSPKEIDDFIDNNKNLNLIFQEVIKQHPSTAKVHPNSLNTIRVMTLLIDNEIKILPCAFRMGVGNSKVDNASSGGIYCCINENGTLSRYGYDALGKKFLKHPDGVKFSDVKINCMGKIKQLVKNVAQRLPNFRLIGWDIGINQNEDPVIIEANLTMSGLDVIETICGPLFGDYTEKVLNEVFINPQKRDISMDISQYV